MRPMTQKQMRQAAAVEYALGGPDFHGDLPSGVRDRICTTASIALGWKDRIKVLFGWSIELEVRTNTENAVGLVRSFTDLRVLRPDWLIRRRSPMGVAILPEESKPE